MRWSKTSPTRITIGGRLPHRYCVTSQKSDPENRILKDFDAVYNVTFDKRFVTARHCLQALWKIGVVGQAHQEKLVANTRRTV